MPYEEIVQWRAIMKAGIQKEPGKTLRLLTIHALFPLSIFTEPLHRQPDLTRGGNALATALQHTDRRDNSFLNCAPLRKTIKG